MCVCLCVYLSGVLRYNSKENQHPHPTIYNMVQAIALNANYYNRLPEECTHRATFQMIFPFGKHFHSPHI